MADGGGPGGYLLGGVACCCAGAGCYYLGEEPSRERRGGAIGPQVPEHPRLVYGTGLLIWTSSTCDFSGSVRSDTPLTTQQSGLQAAIVEQQVTQHYLKKTPKKKAVEEYLVVNKTKEKCGDEHLMIGEEQKDDVGQWTHC